MQPSRRSTIIEDDNHNIEKWIDFLSDRDHNFNSDWLWQYWRKEFRNGTEAPLSKSKLRSQAKLKSLIREGIPTSYREHVWWSCCGK